MRWFKKWEPRQTVYLPDGRSLTFWDAGNGWGLYKTDDTYIIGQLEGCIRMGRGGIEEVTETEFEEVKKKPKTNSLDLHLREVLDCKKLSRMFQRLKEVGENAVEDEKFESWRPYTSEDHVKRAPQINYRPKGVAR